MQVRATASVLACKLCRHEKRVEIDQLLLKRSLKQKDDEGPFNLERVLKMLSEWGVDNPTKENITNHYKKHCEVVSDAEIKEQESAKEEVAARSMAMAEQALGPDWRERVLTPDEYLTLVRIAAQHDLALRMAAGDRTGATIDHGLKSVGEVTKRKSSEALDDVRKGIGSAVEAYYLAAAAEKAAKPGLPPGVQEVIEDAEYEEVEE